jgi:glycosyltransferase involved in cell wall biosynthesis
MVPFIFGGGRNIVDWLDIMLREAGHEVERIYLPHVDSPELLFRQMAAYRWVDLAASTDLIVTFRPPAHLIPHPRKVVWFIHHIRAFYDLWNTAYAKSPDTLVHRGIRDALHAADTAALKEARAVFTNSQVVADRLHRFNDIEGEVLYPPIYQPERFRFGSLGNEIASVSRIVRHKRPGLLIDALRFTRTDVKVHLYGASDTSSHATELRRRFKDAGVEDKVTIDDRWISEEEKASVLADCLALAYVPLDEDSYGYPTLEAAHSSKPTLTTTDSGGVLEFVEDGVTGLVVEPRPEALAAAMDRLFLEREATRRLGEAARARIDEMRITWPHVLDRLLA